LDEFVQAAMADTQKEENQRPQNSAQQHKTSKSLMQACLNAANKRYSATAGAPTILETLPVTHGCI
jgi:hypothetical protein